MMIRTKILLNENVTNYVAMALSARKKFCHAMNTQDEIFTMGLSTGFCNSIICTQQQAKIKLAEELCII